MLLQLVFFLPCLVALLWFFTYVFKSRTQRQSLLMWMQGAGVIYYTSLALYISPGTDYLDMVKMDTVGTPMVFVMFALSVLYLHLHKPGTQLKLVHLLLGIPALVEGVVVNLMYYLEGYDRVAQMIEIYDKTNTIAPEFQTGPMILLNLFGGTVLNILAMGFMAILVVQCVLLLKHGGYRAGDVFRFFFKKHPSTPSRVTAVLFLALTVVLIPIATMGRTFVFNHPLIGASTTIGIAVLNHLICFVEFFSGQMNEVSLHVLSHVKGENEVNAIAVVIPSVNSNHKEDAIDTIEETPAVASDAPLHDNTEDETPQAYHVAQKPARVTSRSRFMEQRLLQLFEEEKIYRNDALTLDTLAERIGVSIKTLSPFISNHFGVPFRTLLNNYRVEAVKEFMLENPTATQDVVASKCGYKDAPSLNRKFKEATGDTPLMWLAKQHKAQV